MTFISEFKGRFESEMTSWLYMIGLLFEMIVIKIALLYFWLFIY